ncbi:MAG: MerR family transcriptional regulator, partial [Eubacteriales bacterium]
MESIGNAEKVREQYKTAANLQTRISLHAKYSVNRQGFGNWIYEQYRLNEHDCILELGCGDGSMWKTHSLPTGASLILTDFSEGMLASAKANVP